ncbi:hypothetical protein V8E36_005146 [Tilletia maclaganii]
MARKPAIDVPNASVSGRAHANTCFCTLSFSTIANHINTLALPSRTFNNLNASGLPTISFASGAMRLQLLLLAIFALASTVLAEMKSAFASEASSSSGKAPLIITVAAPADPDKVKLFDVKAVSQSIDWYNLMSYDFKINAGLPAYGRVWTLNDVNQNTPGSKGSAGVAGRCTGQQGFLGYFEIMEILRVYDALGTSHSHYFYKPRRCDQWIGFDNDESIRDKVTIIKQKKSSRWHESGPLISDTQDYSFTRNVIDSFSGCPLDGLWPATPIGSSVSVALHERRHHARAISSASARRAGVWSTVDLSQCQDKFSLKQYAGKCV